MSTKKSTGRPKKVHRAMGLYKQLISGTSWSPGRNPLSLPACHPSVRGTTKYVQPCEGLAV